MVSVGPLSIVTVLSVMLEGSTVPKLTGLGVSIGPISWKVTGSLPSLLVTVAVPEKEGGENNAQKSPPPVSIVADSSALSDVNLPLLNSAM